MTALTPYRVLHQASNRATARAWHATTLLSELGIEDVNEDDAYHAMDWLTTVKDRTEANLAARHLNERSRVLTDVNF